LLHCIIAFVESDIFPQDYLMNMNIWSIEMIYFAINKCSGIHIHSNSWGFHSN